MLTATAPLGSDNLRASLLILGAMGCFAMGDAIVKLLTETYPLGEILACRSAVCLTTLTLLRPRGAPVVPRAMLQPANLARAALEVGVTTSFFSSLIFLPLGDATSIMFLSPMILTALAALLLGEQVGWRRWLAVALGFVGVLVITRPGSRSFDPAMLLPLLAACCVAARDIVIRLIPPEVGARTVVMTTSAALGLVGLATLPFAWRPPELLGLLGFVACGLTVTSAYLLYVRGTRIGEISFVQPFKYVSIPLSFLMGLIVWGDRPDGGVILGALLIGGSGLFIAWRHRQLARPRA